MIDDCVVILINLYNPNTEKEQVSTWEKLNLMLQTFDDLENKIIILGGDFNLFLDSAYVAEASSPILKNLLLQSSLKLKKNTTYATIGELEIQKKNASHFDKTIAQIFYKED